MIEVVAGEVAKHPRRGRNVIVATGPLTSDALAADIEARCGGSLSFYDAAAPIVTFESLDHGAGSFSPRATAAGRTTTSTAP